MSTVAILNEDELGLMSAWDDQDRGFGALRCEQGCLPLRALEVHATLTGLVARTVVRQRFVNTYSGPIEATYIFPLPSRAAVTHFALRVAGRLVEGQLKERGQARQEYDHAIASGHRAAIAEQERPDVFTMRVGNVPPGQEATVELVLCAPLEVLSGQVTWRFPLVVAPRYIPGQPLVGEQLGLGTASDTDAVPDASRISPPTMLPDYPHPIRLSLVVDVETGGLPLRGLKSSLHAVCAQAQVGGVRVEVVPGERVNRDFILRYGLSQELLGCWGLGSLDSPAWPETPSTGEPSPGEGSPVEGWPGQRAGTFEVGLAPGQQDLQGRAPRDVVFVLDRSGSMEGWKMVAARRCAARMIDGLDAGDRFALLAFDTALDSPPGHGLALVQATDRQRYRAVEYLASLQARGGTELSPALDVATSLLLDESRGASARHKVIVLVTDGQVGDEDQILRRLGPSFARLRVFTVGIDRAINEGFLRRMADLGGGRFELVESEDRLDEVMAMLHQRIDVPLVTQVRLRLEGAQLQEGSLTPATHAALLAGSPLVLRGRMSQVSGPVVAVLEGLDASGQPFARRVPVPLGQAGHSALGALWARAKLRELEDRYTLASGQARAALESAILSLSLTHRVLCRFTAFVAVDRHETIESSQPLRHVVQAVESPEGWAGSPGGSQPPLGGAQPTLGRRAQAPSAAHTSKRADESARARVLAPSPAEPSPVESVSAKSMSAESMAPPAPAAPMPLTPVAPSPARMMALQESSVDIVDGYVDIMDDVDSVYSMDAVDRSPRDSSLVALRDEEEEAQEAPSKELERAVSWSKGAAPGLGAVSASGASVTPTAGHIKPGALRLMSPEQARGLDAAQPSLVFGLAALLVELLTGRSLFGRDNALSILEAILALELPSPLLDPGPGQAFEATLLVALSERAQDRFDSLAAFGQALEQVLASMGLSVSLQGARHGESVLQLLERAQPRSPQLAASVVILAARALVDYPLDALIDLERLVIRDDQTLELLASRSPRASEAASGQSGLGQGDSATPAKKPGLAQRMRDFWR